ncbi:MAG: o-succinylbenzoate synthase [Actinomycetota bacterium]|nr:o-succinylbenzoate synthase [Actinomycetota bacterium]
MKIEGFELRRLELPLKAPFETSFGVQTSREVILVRAVTSVGEGWGECVAMQAPLYSPEFNDSVVLVMRDSLMPALSRQHEIGAAQVGSHLLPFKGHRMAKAALEMALLDAELRHAKLSFGAYLGADKPTVPAGVSVGIQPDLEALLRVVTDFVDEGYLRIKLKIKPGWDIEPVRAVRERFGDDLLLQVDANTAYTLADARLLAKLDDFDLLLIEQPLGEEDLTEHAELAKLVRTPICLDESIVSAKAAADAIRLGACSIVNIKPGRVGGYLEARRIHDVCVANGIAVWCGGMLETGLGRAANIALAALPGFVLPGDTSASDRFYVRDLTEPFVLTDGHVTVPTGPGLGVEVLPDVLAEMTRSTEWIPAAGR